MDIDAAPPEFPDPDLKSMPFKDRVVAAVDQTVTESRPLLSFGPADTSRIPTRPEGRVARSPIERPSPAHRPIVWGPASTSFAGALEAKRAELATTTGESDPELVAVFDVIGSVDGVP